MGKEDRAGNKLDNLLCAGTFVIWLNIFKQACLRRLQKVLNWLCQTLATRQIGEDYRFNSSLDSFYVITH